MFDLLAFVANQSCHERLLAFADVGLDGPVLAGLECLDLELPLDDHAQRRTLYASGRQAALDLLPEQRRKIETDQVVERPARLLRTDEIARYTPRIFNRFLNRVFCDFVKYDTMYRLVVERILLFQQFGQMPGNRFAFPVRVSREIECIGVF